METVTILLSLFAALAVPLGLIATVQYCVYFDIELDFKKLLIFSWSLALFFMPFSFGFFATVVLSTFSGDVNTGFLLVSLVYFAFGWVICSIIYGKPIVPRFSERGIKLP